MTSRIVIRETSYSNLLARGNVAFGLRAIIGTSVYVQNDAPVGVNWVLEKQHYSSFGQNGVIFMPSHEGFNEP